MGVAKTRKYIKLVRILSCTEYTGSLLIPAAVCHVAGVPLFLYGTICKTALQPKPLKRAQREIDLRLGSS